MKIKKANAGSLTNFEVLDFLRSRGASKDPTRVMSSLAPSEFKVYDYLVTTPACDQTRENIHEFIEKSKAYQLAKAELINIINIRPASEVEFAPIIEEYDTRLNGKLDELAEIVQVLPPPPSEPNEEEEPAMDEDSVEATDDKTNNGEEEEQKMEES